MNKPPALLSQSSLDAIDKEITKYPKGQQQSAVMSALRIAQEEKGWLSTETIEYVADYLNIPAVRALEVATFYNMYDLKPVGKYKICLCTNLPCALRGAMKTKEALEETLGISFGETSADGAFTLREGECFGSCDGAPVMIVNNKKMYSLIDAEGVPGFIESLKDGS